MNRKGMEAFFTDTKELSMSYLKEVGKDITHFCRMFDYRNKNADWGNSRMLLSVPSPGLQDA